MKYSQPVGMILHGKAEDDTERRYYDGDEAWLGVSGCSCYIISSRIIACRRYNWSPGLTRAGVAVIISWLDAGLGLTTTRQGVIYFASAKVWTTPYRGGRA